MQRFTAKIHKVGINPCVAVPAALSRAYGRRGYVPVIARLGKTRFQANLVPVGGGRHRLYLNRLMLDAAKKETGDQVTVKLAVDTASRILPVPPDLARALRGKAMKAFLAETPSQRKEIIRWVGGTKNPATRAQRIAKAAAHFVGETRRR